MRKSATTPRGEEVGIAKDLRAPLPERDPIGRTKVSRVECLNASAANCATLCEKPAFSSYCLKEAIEKDEDLQPWDAETKTWVVPPSLTGLATSSEGPPRASGDEETKTSEAKTKLPREGLLRPGLTCPRSRGEEIREKRVKSKTRPGKRQSVYFPRQSIRAPRAVLREPEIENWREQN